MAAKGRNSAGADLFKTSAFLMREYTAKNLAHASSDGADAPRKMIYVYDSDIIKTRCAPWVTGPASSSEQPGNGYGQIFAPAKVIEADGEGSEGEARQRARTAEKFAWILARHALRQGADGSNALFQLPSHFSETSNVYRAVRRQVEAIDKVDTRRSHMRRNFELARLLAVVRHRIVLEDNDADLSEIVKKIADLLVYRFDDDTKRSRILRDWDTYFDLEAEYGGIYSVSFAANFYPDEPAIKDAMAVFVEQNRTADEQHIYLALRRHWSRTLHKPDTSLDTDLEALAHLYLVNLRLLDHDVRVVFVSGDRNLVESTYGDLPVGAMLQGCTDLKLRIKAELLSKSFSTRHVRHLWAFVNDALVEQTQQGKLVDLIEKVLKKDLFGGLLARWSGNLEVRTDELERLARGENRGRDVDLADHQVEEILLEWHKLTQRAIRQSALSLQDEAVQAAILQRVHSRSIGSTWTDLINILQEDVARVRDRAVLALASLGIRQVIRASMIGTRNPPEIVFDSLTRTNALVQRFARAGAAITIEEFISDFGSIKEDCHDSSVDGDDRQESYLKFIVLGAAFASAERWLIANSYAEKSIAIIDRSSRIGSPLQTRSPKSTDEPGTNMSGREAFFLAAVSRRMLAHDNHDIVCAEEFLSRAERALSVDHRRKTARNITPARFINERAALRLSQYYLSRSRNQSDYFNELVLFLYLSIEEVLTEFRPRFQVEECLPLERVTIVGAATNVIQCYVISEFRRHEGVPFVDHCPVRKNDVFTALLVLKRHTTFASGSAAVDGRITATPLMKSYGYMAEVLLGISGSADGLIAELEELQGLSNLYVTHYDRWRYQALLSFAKRYRHLGRAESILADGDLKEQGTAMLRDVAG